MNATLTPTTLRVGPGSISTLHLPSTEPATQHTLVAGIGNIMRGDDAAGLVAACRIAETDLDGVTILEEDGPLDLLLDSWLSYDLVILIDAVHSGAPSGTIFRFDARTEPLPAIFPAQISSHGMGIPEAVELARALDQLPPGLIVYGIEGQEFEAGAGLTAAVEAAVDDVVERVTEEARIADR
jgi:hydrogenase maturation protease